MQKSSKKQNKINNPTSVPQVLEKAFGVELKGTLQTRRSYSNIQFMDDEREIGSYLTKQQKSNPEIYPPMNKEDSIWFERFEKLGFIRDYGFLIKKFKTQTKSSSSLQTFSGDTVSFKFYRDSATTQMWFTCFFKSDTININTETFTLQNLDYAFLDVIPGGNKELVFLDDYYVMNGDNFNFLVYEIETK